MTDFLEAAERLADGLKQAAFHLAEHRKHVDHHVGAQLHRLETVMRDCGRQIADALAAMPDSLRDRLDAIEQD
jgi:hypothetical protein